MDKLYPKPVDPTFRLYAFLRTDLGMGTGKAVAQCGHAYVQALRQSLVDNPEREQLYHADGLGTKICLAVPNLDYLERAYEQALAAGLPAALITDSGHMSFFDGKPTVTALGLGPVQRHEVKHITKKFQLL